MYDDILVPIDLGHPEASHKAIRSACQIAKGCDAVLHLLTVVQPLDSFTSTFFPSGFTHDATEAAQKALHAFSDAQDLAGMKVHHIVAHGAIYDQILAMSQKVGASIIVMTSHRPELSDYLLGPNAAKVVRHANCSVMIVRE
ncbi:universal stress protein [Roseovarius sp. 2305UL8-3]|uniref:universal stress protein n=1 Tax=Roseovarius conchicola TaxID=3121636 RepID=UPI0035292F22